MSLKRDAFPPGTLPPITRSHPIAPLCTGGAGAAQRAPAAAGHALGAAGAQRTLCTQMKSGTMPAMPAAHGAAPCTIPLLRLQLAIPSC